MLIPLLIISMVQELLLHWVIIENFRKAFTAFQTQTKPAKPAYLWYCWIGFLFKLLYKLGEAIQEIYLFTSKIVFKRV
jgi:hypothetical protein